jgi:hypothetical protein
LVHEKRGLRLILNFAPRGKLCPPPRAKLSPRGEFCPLGVKFSVCPSIPLNSRECSPLWVNEGVNILLGANFTPLGANYVVKDWPPDERVIVGREKTRKFRRNFGRENVIHGNEA